MKEKVKDLDPVLSTLVFSTEEYRIKGNTFDLAQPYLDKVDWSKCSNEERLKYAELMYKPDTEIVSTIGNSDTIVGIPWILSEFTNDIMVKCMGNDRIVYQHNKNKWAKIISRPDEKEETKEPFKIIFNNDNTTPEDKAIIEKLLKEQWGKTGKAGSMIMNVEPEFQQGEIVDEYRNGDIYMRLFYRFFADGKHWVSKGIDDDHVFMPEEIRKIQPDHENKYREEAQAIMRKISEVIESMLIEALKTEVK